jgi:hypothetical protein
LEAARDRNVTQPYGEVCVRVPRGADEGGAHQLPREAEGAVGGDEQPEPQPAPPPSRGSIIGVCRASLPQKIDVFHPSFRNLALKYDLK